jgi:hypothetical protein
MSRGGLAARIIEDLRSAPKAAGADKLPYEDDEESGSPHWQRLGVATAAANGEPKARLAEGVRA